MSASPTTMMVSVPHFGGGLQVQHCTVSLPRIDALLEDPDTRYFMAVEQRVAPSVSVGGPRRRGRVLKPSNTWRAGAPGRPTLGTVHGAA